MVYTILLESGGDTRVTGLTQLTVNRWRNHTNEQTTLTLGTVQGQIQPARLGGERFQKYLVVKSHNGFPTVREMKQASQHCCDQTKDDKMALYRECCFPNFTKSW